MTKAFTLIELLIALGLGMVIMLTAVAGLRVASQGITTANRLSLENRLIRAGMIQAVEQVDFWTDVDDPTRSDISDSSNGVGFQGQALRAWSTTHPLDCNGVGGENWDQGQDWSSGKEPSAVKGGPFTPFAITNGSVFLWERKLETGTTPEAERERGWDARYSWPAADPRTWWYGNYGERGTNWSRPGDLDGLSGPHWANDQHLGRYALFSNRKTRPTLGNDPNGRWGDTGPFGQVEAVHTWRDNQLIGLRNALGLYGLWDYVPGNAIGHIYGDIEVSNNSVTSEVDERYMTEWFSMGQGAQHKQMRSRLNGESSWYTAIWPSSPSTPTLWFPGQTDQPTKDKIIGQQRGYFKNEGGINKRGFQKVMHAFIKSDRSLLPQKPTSWPSLSVIQRRFCVANHFVNLCEVRWQMPTTGEEGAITFNTFGTTLRGARQQRAYDPRLDANHDGWVSETESPTSKAQSWATWYGLNDPRNDLSLDDYPTP